MFTKEDRKLLNEMLRRFGYSIALDTKKHDELLYRVVKAESDNAGLRAKVDIYEKLIAKMLDSNSKPSDEIFMIDGKIYKPISHTITATKGQHNTATVEFICVSDISSLLEKGE